MSKFVLNREGVKALLKSEEMQNVLNSYGQEVLQNCGSGYEMETRAYHERNGVAITANSLSAKIDNSTNNTLLKALGSMNK